MTYVTTVTVVEVDPMTKSSRTVSTDVSVEVGKHPAPPRPFDKDKRMNVNDAAKRFAVSATTLRKYINLGLLTHYNIGRNIYVYEDDVVKSLELKNKHYEKRKIQKVS